MNRLYVVGLGPGKLEGLTIEAKEALDKCEMIIGYSKYVELIQDYFPKAQFADTGMRKEVERVNEALAQADSGKVVGLVCSGDAGVYGMAGLAMELGVAHPDVEIVVIAGVTAALSGASVLGAPIGHDFTCISLSDLLTPWELIEKRLDCAAQCDLCMAIYNPSSHKRSDYLQKACDIIMRHKSPETVCGYVKNIGREGEAGYVLTLKELRDTQVDMFTTVFIGNAATKVINGKMVTPRGYRNV
jgi:precorrin-3B C17-methyltransferase